MAKSTTAAALETQHQIRANAAELQDYFADLYAWEKAVGREEEARKRAPPARVSAPPVRSARPPAAHTHDRGYSKWAKFDVEAALREADDESGGSKSSAAPEVKAEAGAKSGSTRESKTPATNSTSKSREEIEREEGNEHYKRGDFVAAIKCYTRCLGYNARNAVVLSNRAMAYLKNREFAKAEDDCNLALRIDPDHLKSLSRRATARNALGKHRLALLDFERAAVLDPKSRQIQSQIASTKELMRAAIKRAPTQKGKLRIEVIDEAASDATSKLQAQESTSRPPFQADEPEDKENASANKATDSLKSADKSEVSTATTLSTKAAEKAAESQAATTASAPQTSPTPSIASTSLASVTTPIVPKLPKKPPTTSYEFSRVWKSLALKGDREHRERLLAARAAYLQGIRPTALSTIFKNSIEPEIVCETFHVFRHAVLSSSSSPVENGASTTSSPSLSSSGAFVLEFARELAKVPRFSMAVMFLSEREKADIAWVLNHLHARAEQEADTPQLQQLEALKKVYELS